MIGDCKFEMKVLWFSNCPIGDDNSNGSGSWLYAMKHLLKESITLINITQGFVSDITHNKYDKFEEYILPQWRLTNGLPNIININKIKRIVNDISPDIIHIWGTEKYWGLLFSRGLIEGKPILEIQGLLSSCDIVYDGGLKSKEIRYFWGLKDLLYKFIQLSTNNLKYEEEIISNSKFISTQSNWTRDQISFLLKSDSVIYKTIRPLRHEFYKAKKWRIRDDKNEINVYTSYSYTAPFKGLHVLFKAIALLKERERKIKLNIAGPDLFRKPFFRKGWYEYYLLNLIEKYNLKDSINFIGQLNSSEIINALHSSDIYVNPSFVESFSAATAEALILGVPSVLSYAGALPNFSENSKIALYYSPMDYVSCAARIDEIINNIDVSRSLSVAAYSKLNEEISLNAVKKQQLKIYNKHLTQCSKKI